MLKELGLYVHIPFCKSKCAYCNFNSCANKSFLMDDYLHAILKEINNVGKNYKECLITTIYIGGGTPSNFIAGGISTILNTIKNNFNVSENAEISIECNPNSVTIQNASEWFRSGVNRVSCGLQSSKQNILNLLSRTHTKYDYINAIEILKQVGFKNISTDIMICLPTQKQSHIKSTINLIKKLECSHISAYSLILEEGTPMYQKVLDGKIKLPKENKCVSMYNFTVNYLNSLGYKQYEVSNFCKDNKKCLHNLNCWNMVPYIGFGAGAHSFTGEKRYSNFCNIEQYISSIQNNLPCTDYEEVCTNTSLFEEYVMLKLRTVEGVDLNYIKTKYNIDLYSKKKKVINNFIENEFIKLEDNCLKPTLKGYLILNKIILDLVY